MDSELSRKVAKLPLWARELIGHLEALPDTLANEVVHLRARVAELRKRNRDLGSQVEAMTELFRYAAIGGSEGAKKIVEILDGYEIFPGKKSEGTDDGRELD